MKTSVIIANSKASHSCLDTDTAAANEKRSWPAPSGELGRDAFDLSGLIDDFHTWYEQLLCAKGLKLITVIGPVLPNYFCGNRHVIEFSLQGLARNTLRQLGTEDPLLEITVEHLEEHRHSFSATITVPGPPIKPSQIKDLFQRSFSHTDGKSSRLRCKNLYYPRMIARMSGGDIRIENDFESSTRYHAEIHLFSIPT